MEKILTLEGRVITSLKHYIGRQVIIRREREIVGDLCYEGDVGSGDGFLVPVGTGRFFVLSDGWNPEDKGYRTRRSYIRM